MKICFALLLSVSAIYSSDYLHSYQRGRYKLCINQIETLAKTNALTDHDKMIYADCLFKTKKFSNSAAVYLSLLSANKANSIKSASRVIEIYRLGEKEIELKKLTSYILEKKVHFLNLQLQPVLLANNEIELFLKMYKEAPTNLSQQQWNQLSSVLTEQQFNTVVENSNLPERETSLYRAYFWLAHKKENRALEILKGIIDSVPDERAIVLKARIHWHKKEIEQTDETLSRLKSNGAFGYRRIADFYFQNSRLDKAQEVVDEGISNNFALHDLRVFYSLSEGKLEEAAYLLGKYKKERKILSYRHQALKQDFFRQGTITTKKKYYLGLKRLSKEYPEVCEEAIRYQIPWDTSSNIIQSIKGCKPIQYKHRIKLVYNSLYKEARYQVLFTLLAKKKLLEKIELYFLGKAYYKAKQYKRAIFYLNNLIKVDKVNNEARYFLGLAHYSDQSFSEAEKAFSKISYKDSLLLWLNSLTYQKKWKRLKLVLNSPEMNRYYKEKQFFKAIWSLSQNQVKQSEILFESYLSDAGKYGNKAVYLLFLAKYFRQNEKLQSFMSAIAQYPHGLKAGDWKNLEVEIKQRDLTEFNYFVKYWYARYLILSNQKSQALQILKALKANKKLNLAASEVDYLILTLKKPKSNEQTDYLIRFPDSPFRILIQQDSN